VCVCVCVFSVRLRQTLLNGKHSTVFLQFRMTIIIMLIMST